MSGIRVTIYGGEEPVTERILHAYFTKPSNGGGTISSIHYPVFGEAAVIIFEDEHTAEVVEQYKHTINDKNVYVTSLPKLQVFKKLQAEIDPAVTAFLEATEAARDEIVHHGNINYRYDEKTHTSYMTGTWYQLEWAWKFIDDIMHQQQRALNRSAIHKRISDQFRESSVRGVDDSPDRGSKQVYPLRKLDDDTANGSIKLPKGTTKLPGDVPFTISMPDGQRYKGGRPVAFGLDTTLPKAEAETKATAEVRTTGISVVIQRSVSEQGDNVRRLKPKMGGSRSLSVEDKDMVELQCLDFSHEGLKVSLYTGDIILSNTEALVNPGRGNQTGVSYAITNAADPIIFAEIRDYFDNHGMLETGEVMCTSAGGELDSKVMYILHTVGPIWTEDLPEDAGEYQLTTTFLNCLARANKMKLTSITFPAISTGTYMGSVEVCAKCFLDAVLLFAFEHRDKRFLKEVHLVNIDEDTTANMVLALRQVLKKGMDLLTIEASEQMEKMQKTIRKNPGLFAKVNAGLSDFLCGSKKGGTASELPSWRVSGQKTPKTVKPPTYGRPLPKPPLKATGRPGK